MVSFCGNHERRMAHFRRLKTTTENCLVALFKRVTGCGSGRANVGHHMLPRTSTTAAQRGYTSLLVLLVAFNLFLLVGLWVKINIDIQNERRAAIHAATSDMENLVRGYEQYTLRTLRHYDEVTRFLKFQYETRGGIVDFKDFVERGLLPSDALILVSIANEKGELIASTSAAPFGKVSIRDREHFQVHVAADSHQMFISKPVVGRLSKKETLQLTRRLNHPDGTFAGVVVVSGQPSSFTDFYNKADFGKDGMVSLLGTDGAYRAIRIGDSTKSNITVNFPNTLALYAAARKSGTPAVITAIDAIPRISASRQLHDYPILVSVGISMPEVLREVNLAAATYYRWAIATSCFIAGFLVLTALLAFKLINRQAYLAGHDPLTQLPNRMLFLRSLQHEISRFQENNGGTGVLFIDLDNFKNVNDSLGHEMGDALLCAVAERLRASVRKTDTVFRLGGDEFTVILKNIIDDELAVVASKRILAGLEQPFFIDGRRLSIGASVGISRHPLDGNSTSELLKHADIAMYQAKTQERGAYRFFSARLSSEVADRLALEQSIREGIARQEFFLVYQPKIDLKSERIVGFEALLRWQHPSKGIVLPGEFIPAAEATGLILPLGRLALEMACEQMQGWQKAGLGWIPVAVNVSAQQFKRGQLVDEIVATLKEHGVPPCTLEVELTESLVMEDPTEAEVMLLALKAIGIKVSIDDFGTGHSSLASLTRFSVDYLKIDRSFIQNSPEQTHSADIVRAVIALAKSFNLQVIAEGVETSAQLDMLKALSCDMAQGYFYSMPVMAKEVPGLLSRFSSDDLFKPHPRTQTALVA
jgi:diguanylate cyclase (GGDEF)-like protein